MPLHALLYRRPSEPQTIAVVFDGADLPRASAAAPAGAALHAAHPVGDARSHPDHSAARHAQGSARVRAEARRLDRGAARAAAAKRRRSPHGVVVPLRGVPHRIAHRRGSARHGVDRDGRDRRASALRRRRRAACRPAHRRLPAPRSQARSGSRQPPLRARPRRSPSGASPCATSRAAGAPVRPPACCRFPGGSFWRRATCSIISPRTKWRISSR